MIIKINKKSLQRMFLAIYMFIVIFAPPIMPKINIIIALCSMIALSMKYRRSWKDVLRKSKAMHWCIAMLLLAVYACLIILINIFLFNEQVQLSNYLAIVNRFVILTVVAVICSIFLICYLKKNDLSQDDYIIAIIRAGLIQVACVFLSFFSSDIKNIFVQLMRTNTDSYLYSDYWYTTVRSYGFAGTLVDLFGLGMGIIAGFSFFYGLKRGKKYMLYSVLIAIAGTMNARTTIIIYGIAVIIGFVSSISIKKIKTLLTSAIFIISVVFLVVNILPFIKEINSGTYNFIMAGMEEIQALFIEGEVEGTFSVLFSDKFLQIPEPFQLIFGAGHTLFQASGYLHSDMGYINDLWFIGLVGILFLYGFIMFLMFRVYKVCKENLYKMSIIMLVGAFFAFNFKGSIIGPNSGMLLILSTIFVFNSFFMTKENG